MNHERLSLRLYRTHRDTLVDYAGRLSGDRVGAEDIVQDAWLLMDRHRPPEVIREPLGYLKRIVRNLVFSQARRARHEAAACDVGAAGAMRLLADDRPSAEAELLAREEMELVMGVLAALPERQQTAFKMYHFEGLKLREVGERLGVSTSLAHLLVTEAMQLCDERRKRATV